VNVFVFIKFVSNLQQVGGFLWVLRFLPSIKLTITLNTIILTPLFCFSFREAKFLTFYSKSELIKFSKVKFENCDDWFDPCIFVFYRIITIAFNSFCFKLLSPAKKRRLRVCLNVVTLFKENCALPIFKFTHGSNQSSQFSNFTFENLINILTGGIIKVLSSAYLLLTVFDLLLCIFIMSPSFVSLK
jgi:hypothetical protein